MNRPKPPGRLHTGAKIQDVTPGALRAAEILATTQRKPSRKLVLESAMIIDRETDLPHLLAVLSDAMATLRNWPTGELSPGLGPRVHCGGNPARLRGGAQPIKTMSTTQGPIKSVLFSAPYATAILRAAVEKVLTDVGNLLGLITETAHNSSPLSPVQDLRQKLNKIGNIALSKRADVRAALTALRTASQSPEKP